MDDMNQQQIGDNPDAASQGGYCIEIYVGADGKPTSVNVESQDEEGTEDQGMQNAMGGAQDDQNEPQGGDKGVPVASMQEAMSMIHEIIRNQGQMPQDQGTPQDQMMQGYGKGSITSQRGGLPVRKVFSGGM